MRNPLGGLSGHGSSLEGSAHHTLSWIILGIKFHNFDLTTLITDSRAF